MDAKEKTPTSTGVHVNSSELGVGLEEDKPLDGTLGLVTISTLFRFSLFKSIGVRTIGKARLVLHNLPFAFHLPSILSTYPRHGSGSGLS